MNLFEMRKQREEALNKADSIVTAAEVAKRPLTADESQTVDTCMKEVNALTPQIKQREDLNTLSAQFSKGVVLTDAHKSGTKLLRPRRQLSAEYAEDFFGLLASNGARKGAHLIEGVDDIGGFAIPGYKNPKSSAALYEGSSAAGGYAVPITVDDQIVPLAPQEMSVRRLAQVIPTTMDIKIPVKASFSTAAVKAETSAFGESEPTLSQFTLSAYMAGVLQEISWELAQDVPAFQAFAVDDMILAQQMYEENLYINGTGPGRHRDSSGTWEPVECTSRTLTATW